MIKTKRFILRPYGKSDEKSLVENINDWKVTQFMSNIPYPYTLKDARKWIKKCIKNTKKTNKTRIDFAVDINGEIVGGIDLHNIEKHKAEIGYWLTRKLWNKGIMTEALRIMTNYGFNELKLKRISATVDPKNKSSIFVLEKNKYKREGLLRDYAYKSGKYVDRFMYAKLK